MGCNGKENGNYYNGVILGGSQNCGPGLGALNIRRRIIIGIQKGTIILTTTHFVWAISMAAGCPLRTQQGDHRRNPASPSTSCSLRCIIRKGNENNLQAALTKGCTS